MYYLLSVCSLIYSGMVCIVCPAVSSVPPSLFSLRVSPLLRRQAQRPIGQGIGGKALAIWRTILLYTKHIQYMPRYPVVRIVYISPLLKSQIQKSSRESIQGAALVFRRELVG